MKSIITIILCGILLSASAQNRDEELSKHLKALTPEDEILLKNLPVKTIPAGYQPSRDLPDVVDNSQYIYMRPAYNQADYACGQASLIGYNFTYEMARIRDVAADNPDNQYPTHFAWNFMNGGNGYYGVSYLHSAQILKTCGTPNVTTYGGMAAGGYTRWMSGYEDYLSAMENRITTISQMQVGTEEGLQVLKYWLYDHLEGSEYGGLASFYAQYLTVTQTLPSGTPEGGKYVITSFGGSANHAMTIVGYNDSIRWDYNGDGQYTNDIDINNDGVVDMKDWEIGGFKMVQSYGGVPNWGDGGYAYMMYKTVADNLGEGGIWNHCVHVLDVKEEYNPELVAKVVLKHDRRLAIKVIAGFSNNPADDTPEYTLDLPIFNYQGGDHYMQGGDTEEDKTIEFGLDFTPFLTYLDLGSSAKFFIQVSEIDPWHLGSGEIVSFTLYDYTNGINMTISPQTNVPIVDNDTTTVHLSATIDSYDRIQIETDELPQANIGQQYSFQMTASGGATPYFWDFDKTYDETTGTGLFNEIDAVQLSPSNNSGGMVTQPLDFDFPFYDSVYSSITVHVDGYLMFDEQLYPYPYFHDDNVLFKVSRNISPFMTQFQLIDAGAGGGIWYEGDENSATFRWKTKIDGESSSDLNYSVTLYPDGKIEYRYGVMTGFGNLLWLAGVSDGDNTNYTRCALSNTRTIPENYKTELFRYDYPDEMAITQDGLFYGIPEQMYPGSEIKFKVTDNEFVSSVRELTFVAAQDAMVIVDSVEAGGDNIIEYGETVYLTYKLVNTGEDDLTNVTIDVTCSNPFITLTDDHEDVGTVEVGETVWVTDAISFRVHNDIPNNTTLSLDLALNDENHNRQLLYNYIAYAPVINLGEISVNDDNGLLDPGETTDIIMVFYNDGGAVMDTATVVLQTDSDLLTVNNDTQTIIPFAPGTVDTLAFSVTVSDEALVGQIVDFNMSFAGSNEYNFEEDFSLPIGLNHEDFESGGFQFLSWGYLGAEPWQIDDLIRYEGQYSARSGFIISNDTSSLIADIYVLAPGDISFYKKVSSEEDYDEFTFFIDGQEQESWSGLSDWSLKSYLLDEGFHRLEWRYQKNGENSRNMDGAWLDMITFPPFEDAPPSLEIDSSQVHVNLTFDQTETVALGMENPGEGNIRYEMYLSSNTDNNPPADRSVYGSYLYCPDRIVHAGETYEYQVTIYNTSPDNEWIRDLSVAFPEGVVLEDATAFVGGTGDLLFNGETGNGVTATWHGEDGNGWGVIKGGETAVATLTFSIQEDFTQSFVLSYLITGDIYGSLPHEMPGDLDFTNLGQVLDWVSLATNNGQLEGGYNGNINLNFNSEGLDEGYYHATLLVYDNFENEHIIPIELHVEQYVDLQEHNVAVGEGVTQVFPNPFNNYTDMEVIILSEGVVNIDIINMHGKTVRRLSAGRLDKGTHVIRWDGRTDAGAEADAGLYLCRFSKNGAEHYTRLIKN